MTTTRQKLTAVMVNNQHRTYEGVNVLNWGPTEITFSHDGGYETLNRCMFAATTLKTEVLQ